MTRRLLNLLTLLSLLTPAAVARVWLRSFDDATVPTHAEGNRP